MMGADGQCCEALSQIIAERTLGTVILRRRCAVGHSRIVAVYSLGNDEERPLAERGRHEEELGRLGRSIGHKKKARL